MKDIWKLSIDEEKTANKIKLVMKEKNVNPKKIKEVLNLETVQTVYKWLSAKSLPSIDNLFRLCSMLEVSVEQLIVLKGEEDE